MSVAPAAAGGACSVVEEPVEPGRFAVLGPAFSSSSSESSPQPTSSSAEAAAGS